MTSELRVRRARAEDVPVVAEIHRRSILELCAQAYPPEVLQGWVDGRPPDRHRQLFEQKHMVVCEREGEVLGFGIVDLEGSRVFAVYVAPTAARAGVGRLLLAALEDAARAAGLVRLELHATLNAVPFYERSGFIAERTTRVALSNGLEIDAVKMGKSIAAAGSRVL